MSTWEKVMSHLSILGTSWSLSENYSVKLNDDQDRKPSFVRGRAKGFSLLNSFLTSLKELHDANGDPQDILLYPIPTLISVFYILAKEKVPGNHIWYARQFHVEHVQDNSLDTSLLVRTISVRVGYKICPEDHCLASWDLSFDDERNSKGLIFLEHAL